MESVKCDLCGSASSHAVAKQTDVFHGTTKDFFTIVRCDGCGLCFTNPRPDKTEIARHYPDDYSYFEKTPAYKVLARRLLDRLAASPAAAAFSWIPPVSRQLAQRLKPLVKDPVLTAFEDGLRAGILDIGCGSGDHANFWGHSGGLKAYQKLMPVSGVEASPLARERLGAFGIQAWAGIEEVPGALRWPIIRMNWSLEHVHEPSAYFTFINEHLAPGGRAIICVPNYDGLIYRLAPDCVEMPIHLYHFTAKHLGMYAEKSGLRVRESATISYPAMFFDGVRAGLLPAGFGVNLGIGEAKSFQRALDRFDNAGYGNDLVAVLERRT